MKLLTELNAVGTTIAVITHEHEVADRLPRQVAVRDGQIIADTATGAARALPVVPGLVVRT